MIQAHDVCKTFPSGDEQVEALRGVSFRIRAGSSAFIVGPSGSGKSTLLYILGTLEEPTSGTIHIDGQEVTALSEVEQDRLRRDRLGFVFQSFNLIGTLSAVDNVLLPYLAHGRPRELRRKAIDLLGRMGLGNRLRHRPHQLSGGQQQRVAIARALIKDPGLILADEPTGELDSKGGDEIFAILREYQAERRSTLVVVTHARRLIDAGDQVLELEDGRLREDEGTDVTSGIAHARDFVSGGSLESPPE
ncbi:MAG: ABC transporter ATP-binding protein [Isosphaeraceae bacterium]